MNKLNQHVNKVIVVDPGKNTTEAFCFSPDYKLLAKMAFPSKSKKKRNFYDIDSSSENQYRVEYRGEKFLIGEGILGDYNFETTKNNHHHQLCVYTAIASMVEDKDVVHLVVGYPSSDFVNAQNRKDYADLLYSSDPITFTVNEEEKTFTIASIEVKPEGVAMKPRVEKVGNKVVKNIDIGGENINYRHYDEKGNTLASLSLDGVGVNHLESFLKTRIRKFVNIHEVDIESINYIAGVKAGKLVELRDGDLTSYKNSAEFIQDAVLDFIEERVLGGLKAKGINLYQRGDKIIFTGGGSVLLQSYLESLLANNAENLIFSATAYWDNCISYTIKDIGDRCKTMPGDKAENMKLAQQLAAKVLKETNF